MFFLKCVSLFLLGIGIFVLMQVLMPFISYQSWEVFTLDKSALLANPRPRSLITGDSDTSIQNLGNFPAFIVKTQRTTVAPYKEFKLTINKINLKDISVMVDSNEFDKNLGHLPGTALPGEKGNVFVSGHSSLSAPLFFKDDGRKAFFARLTEVTKGDEISINVLGQEMKYQVVGLRVVDPKDVSVINPPDDEGRYLSLMTCVPPGFNTKRLIVLAKLKNS